MRFCRYLGLIFSDYFAHGQRFGCFDTCIRKPLFILYYLSCIFSHEKLFGLFSPWLNKFFRYKCLRLFFSWFFHLRLQCVLQVITSRLGLFWKLKFLVIWPLIASPHQDLCLANSLCNLHYQINAFIQKRFLGGFNRI